VQKTTETGSAATPSDANRAKPMVLKNRHIFSRIASSRAATRRKVLLVCGYWKVLVCGVTSVIPMRSCESDFTPQDELVSTKLGDHTVDGALR
jgi:hypothetical protein